MTISVSATTARSILVSHSRPSGAILLTVALGCSACSTGPAPSSSDEVLHGVRVAEDARDASEAGLAPIREGLTHSDPEVRRTSARALGRLENPDLIEALLPALSDPEASVRLEVVDAVGQAGHVSGWVRSWDALSDGLPAEASPIKV